MRFYPTGPGRVGGPVLEDGDQVALADRYGGPVGEWHTVDTGLLMIALPVPVTCQFRVSRWLARDRHGRVQFWSDSVCIAVAAGGHLMLPLPRAPRVEQPPPRPEPIPASPGRPELPEIPEVTDRLPPRDPGPRPGPRPGPPPRFPVPHPPRSAPQITWSSG